MRPAAKQAEPPIRIVASGTGGGNNVVARLIAEGLAEQLNEPVVVDNRPEKYAAAKIVAASQPDGRTLLLYGSSLWLAPLMHNDVPYDAIRDFSPVILAARSTNVLVVHKSVAADSVVDLVQLCQGPCGIKCGYSVPCGSPHLAAELFKAMAAIDISTVAYGSVACLFDDLLNGKIQMMFPNAAAARLHLKSGQLKALAVTSARPSRQFPLLPAVSSTLPGYVSEAVFPIFAPAGTPVRRTLELHDAVARALSQADVQQHLSEIGLETAADTPETLAAMIESDVRRMKIILDRLSHRTVRA